MKNQKGLLVLIGLGIIFTFIPFLFKDLFGSNVDWINQHITFVDYFRNIFYKTGKIIPNIAWNLGMGQNIYNFSYYGLLNPIILISYLLPFISMANYIMISSIICYLASVYLFYKWISNKFDNKLSFLLTFLFMCCAPLFYHFHRQIMFVNYFPFLLLVLNEIDKSRKHSLLLITIFITLLIFTSYYYSVGGILCIIAYYFYVNYSSKLKDKIKIFIPIIISILSSGIILIPTLYTILSGRNDISNGINILNLIIPDFSFGNVIYGPYTLGFTALVIISLIGLLINKDKKNKYLSIFLLLIILFPIFRYLLNGCLYIRSKSLIPFIPLYILCIGIFLNKLNNKEINFSNVVKIVLITVLIGLVTGYFNIWYYLDLVLNLFLIKVLFYKKRNILYGIIIIEIFTMFIAFNLDEKYVSSEEYKSLHNYDSIINDTIKNDSSFYRFSNITNPINNINTIINSSYYSDSMYSSTYNHNYYNFYHNSLNTNNDTYNHLMLESTSNIIMNRLFGVKYVLTNDSLGYGYKLISKYKDAYLYQNIYSMALGYSTNTLYNNLSNNEYPYNLEALLTGIVVDNAKTFVPTYTNELKNNYEIQLGDNISVSNNEDYMLLEVTENSKIELKFNSPILNKLLFIEISGLEETDNEISIEINNVKNKLTNKDWSYPNKNNTFHFLISDNKIDWVNMNISKGIYKITSVNLYTMDNNILNTNFDYMENISIKDNKLVGDVNVTNNGYMALSIPYDKGFTIRIDDSITDYEIVNNGFIGFKITSGYHKIEVIYNSPYYKEGFIVSIIGFVLLLGVFIYTKVDNKH